MNKILFLCSGNYYRSRFAEEYFNHLAEIKGLNWRAFSKGLSQNMPNPNNPGSMSVHAINALVKLNIEGKNVDRLPSPIHETDFISNDKIIALSEKEHRPMLEMRFNQYANRIQYFEVGDSPVEEPGIALKRLARLISDLTNQLDT